ICALYRLFFFFQAEDGIRDYKVTGVQTCALPISGRDRGVGGEDAGAFTRNVDDQQFETRGGAGLERTACVNVPSPLVGQSNAVRSEERRVGKECRSRWSPYH